MNTRSRTTIQCLRIVEAKCGFGLINSNLPRDLGDVAIERTAQVVVITEDESLLHVEADSDDVLRVPIREFMRLFGFQLMLEQKFLVVCDS